MSFSIEGKNCYGEKARVRQYHQTGNGLAVVREVLNSYAAGYYGVIVTASGYRLATYKFLWQAIAAMEMLAPLGDWTEINTVDMAQVDETLAQVKSALVDFTWD